MEPYRCYFRDEAGHILALQTIRCGGDDEARETATALFRRGAHHAVELWATGRRLLRLTRASISASAN